MTDRLAAAVAELVDALRDELRAEPAPDRLLDIAATAEALSIGRSKVYGEIAAGRLRSLQIGDRRLVSSSAIADYIGSKSPPEAGK
jgi:excisionase family DNA binding protein